MHIPLHLAILLYLFKKGSTPETLTELNEQFVIHTVYRHLEKQSHQPTSSLSKEIERITDLPENVLKFVQQLSKLAMSC